MRNYWFGKHCSNWEVWVMMLSGYALGNGYVWLWVAVLLCGAAVEGCVGER